LTSQSILVPAVAPYCYLGSVEKNYFEKTTAAKMGLKNTVPTKDTLKKAGATGRVTKKTLG
jgi:hypothetical protein